MVVLLAILSDVGPGMFFVPICPSMVILSWVVEQFHPSNFPTWSASVFLAAVAAGNAAWYMLLVETVRMLIARVRCWRSG